MVAPPTVPDMSAYPHLAASDLVEMLPAGAPAEQRIAVADPYRVLEDPDDPATAAWSAAQERLLEAQRATWPGREALAGRIAALVATGSVGGPAWRGSRCFSTQRESDQDMAVLLVIEEDGHGGRAERVLIDPLEVDPSGATTLDAWQPSKEGDLLAYQLSTGGTEESVLRIVDVATGALVDGPLDRLRYSPVAFEPGGGHVYYVRRLPPDAVPAGEEMYHRRVWRHAVGADPATDVEVFGAGRPITSYYGVGVSLDGRWLTISAREGTAPRTDVWIGDLHAPGPDGVEGVPALTAVAEGLDAATSAGVGLDGRLYVATDHLAPRGRLAVADPVDPSPHRWRDLVAERDDAVLEDFVLLDGPDGPLTRLLVSWSAHAVSELSVHDAATGERLGEVALPGVGGVGGLGRRPEGGSECWFGYSDTTTPAQVMRYDAVSGELAVHALAPGVADGTAGEALRAAAGAVTTVVQATSADGTTVRMLVVRPPGARSGAADVADPAGTGSADAPDRPRPTILYGYGGFANAMGPGYSAGALAWVAAGGVYATAQLRGGSEEGEEWHRAGMLEHKQNVFDDVLACADALVEQGWTTPERLCVSGGSNGGLLVGAAITQAPHKFAAALCSAPLLDMVRYQLHGLGASWAVEYGDAQRLPDLGWLHAYSPYHRALASGPSAYPAVLLTVFAGDTRVDPLHARKTCAALQAATTRSVEDAPVLLRAERGVGHGARAVSRSVALLADSLAFAASRTGLSVGGDEG